MEQQPAATSYMPHDSLHNFSSSSGPGQDFVLFDDGQMPGFATSAGANQFQGSNGSNGGSSSGGTAVNPSMTMTSRPSFDQKPSFTEYRASQSGPQVESPFSSPASRPEDDFGSDQNLTSGEVDQVESGTLAHGTPKSKRQRGHGYSSSWNGGNIQQYRHQNRQGSGAGGTLATAMGPTNSFGGYTGGNASDWSGSDTSPQNPPSGSFGPPIHSLSLGDGGDGMPSLFPTTSSSPASSLQQPSNNINATRAQPIVQASSNPPPSVLLSMAAQQREERARQQVRADLMDVDSRALKGTLRDIQQGGSQDGRAQNVLFPNVAFDSPYPVNNFFPAPMQSSSSNSNALRRPSEPIRQRSGSLDEAFLSGGPSLYSNYNQDDGGSGMGAGSTGWSGQSTNAMNAFDLQGLDNLRDHHHQQQQGGNQQRRPSATSRPAMPSHQYSSRTQQAVDRARAQKPTRKRLTRDGSGLTVSPQEAFLDYDNIDSLIQASRVHSQGLSASAQNLFAPTGINDLLSSESQLNTPKAATQGNVNPFASSSMTHEGTPSLVDASSSSSNGSRETSSISSPLQRIPLNREDTVRANNGQAVITPQQQQYLQAQPTPSSDPLSPAYSMSSSTDDEDEKPYEPDSKHQPSMTGWQFPFPAQPNKSGASGQISHPGPRFSVVSSSSSESEEDEQKVRMASSAAANHQGRRTMGGYGYMGSSEESGLSATGPSSSYLQQMQGSSSSHQQATSSNPSSSSLRPHAAEASHHNSKGLSAHNRSSHSTSGQSDSQSQDEEPSLSPSIRSSAQTIPANAPGQNEQVSQGQQANQRSRSRNRAQAAAAAAAATSASRRSSSASSSTLDEASEWETGEDSEGDGDYREERRGNNAGPGRTKKPSSATKKRRWDGSMRQQGNAAAATGGAAWSPSGGSNAHLSSSSASHLTVCDYVSPLTGESCQTEFHRPYDLARHRETIHAREEALLLRQGRLKKEQCVVLFKEVDPEKSLATVEWKCDGKNGCGSLFSRKDALLRHKRIRGH